MYLSHLVYGIFVRAARMDQDSVFDEQEAAQRGQRRVGEGRVSKRVIQKGNGS